MTRSIPTVGLQADGPHVLGDKEGVGEREISAFSISDIRCRLPFRVSCMENWLFIGSGAVWVRGVWGYKGRSKWGKSTV